jgi:hypothetical protein
LPSWYDWAILNVAVSCDRRSETIVVEVAMLYVDTEGVEGNSCDTLLITEAQKAFGGVLHSHVDVIISCETFGIGSKFKTQLGQTNYVILARQ